MAEKHIYLVRHGQSEYNVAETMLAQDTPLTAVHAHDGPATTLTVPVVAAEPND